MNKAIVVGLLLFSACSVRMVASVETGNAVKGKSIITKELKGDDFNYDSSIDSSFSSVLGDLGGVGTGHSSSSNAPEPVDPGFVR
jgi:hypothetical protein